MVDVYLLLGTNIGKRKDNILIAESEIEERVGKIYKRSKIYESKAWGYDSENSFLNQVLIIHSEYGADELLSVLKAIENSMGRIKRLDSYEDRLIDIDILFYGNQIVDLPQLKIPHPRLHLRRFTLIPLAEICRDFWHPILNKSVSQLLDECLDNSEVTEFLL